MKYTSIKPLNQNKMTAVEWLVDQLFSDNVIFGVSKELFDQAKEMEKEQIIKAWNTRSKIDSVLTYTDNRTAEQYYTETYESNT